MWKYKIIFLISLVIFNELLIYRLQPLTWNKIKCFNDCFRILLVADPQILGNKHEKFYARLDSDRHLMQNYKAAVKFVKPNVIIFLGDLMDEGSIASDRQYLDYNERFMKIFPIPFKTSAIYISGDNDVGGEGGEKIDSRRFEAIFGNKTRWNFNEYNIEVIHFNRIEGKFSEVSNSSKNALKIAVSHFPVINSHEKNVRRALEEFKPKVIFSAHNHKSLLLTENSETLISSKKSFDLHRDNPLIEIQVPSINYRMGTLTIGFGQAVIENEMLYYTPLFVISRFYQLLLYLVLLKVYVISSWSLRCVKHFMRKRERRKYHRVEIDEF